MNESTKQNIDRIGALPMAELVIRVGDTRPVVITMVPEFHQTGEVQFSRGPFEDLMLAEWVLDFLRNALADEMLSRARKVIGDFSPVEEDVTNEVDDIPF